MKPTLLGDTTLGFSEGRGEDPPLEGSLELTIPQFTPFTAPRQGPPASPKLLGTPVAGAPSIGFWRTLGPALGGLSSLELLTER